MQRRLPDIPFEFEGNAVLLEREFVRQMLQAAHSEAVLCQVLFTGVTLYGYFFRHVIVLKHWVPCNECLDFLEGFIMLL